MNEQLASLIKDLGGEEAVTALLEAQKNVLQGEYLTLKELGEVLEETHDIKLDKIMFTTLTRNGLIPEGRKEGKNKLYGQRHIYNYLIAMYLITILHSIERATIIKGKLISNMDDVVEIIRVFEELERENIKSENKTLKGLAMIAKGNRLL